MPVEFKPLDRFDMKAPNHQFHGGKPYTVFTGPSPIPGPRDGMVEAYAKVGGVIVEGVEYDVIGVDLHKPIPPVYVGEPCGIAVRPKEKKDE